MINKKIYIAGHNGMVGSAILRLFEEKHFSNIIIKSSKELNLVDQLAVKEFFKKEAPEIVVLAAAKVGGIQANINNPAIFLYDNLMIQNNVIESAYHAGVKQFVFLGSSCIYPKESPQPMKEEYLLTGKLEPTNEAYALAKIAGTKLLESYRKQYGFNSISLMPCNLYGPNDSFDLVNSHVLSALVKRFVDATEENLPEITLWGTGRARREFMHVDDCARAILFMLEHYTNETFINVGPGTDISIMELADMIVNYTGFKGRIIWDISKPDGMLKKCMDVNRMKELGFLPTISLETGLKEMIDIYKNLRNNG
ncbi:MAG: GDP-L-fucose synthase [Ginsengibacter sp.]